MDTEIIELNKQITADNDIIETTLKKILEALRVNSENTEKIKNYLSTKTSEIQNPNAQTLLLKLQVQLTKNQTNNIKIKTLILKEQNNPKTKIYTPTYQEEQPNEKTEKQEESQI